MTAQRGCAKVSTQEEKEGKVVVTKADIYEKVIFAERPVCPHCAKEMKVWECHESGLSCGSGWGTPYLFVCFNDECPAFVKGWKAMKSNYGRRCSYRCICFPDSLKTEMMMVFSQHDGKASIVDEKVIAADRASGTAEDPAVQELIRCFECRDVKSLLTSVFDEKAYYKVRLKAAELIGELGLIETIEPLRNHEFKDQRIATRVPDAIKRIHKINRTQECPFCTEIVETGATTCRHCGRDLSST